MIIEFYTDGSASPTNPGIGGWGWCLTIYNSTNKSHIFLTMDSGGTKLSTNNKMELFAIHQAFDYAADMIRSDFKFFKKSIKSDDINIIINTDSMYSKNIFGDIDLTPSKSKSKDKCYDWSMYSGWLSKWIKTSKDYKNKEYINYVIESIYQLKLLNKKLTDGSKHGHKIKIQINWVKAHVGIYLNEVADNLAGEYRIKMDAKHSKHSKR